MKSPRFQPSATRLSQGAFCAHCLLVFIVVLRQKMIEAAVLAFLGVATMSHAPRHTIQRLPLGAFLHEVRVLTSKAIAMPVISRDHRELLPLCCCLSLIIMVVTDR